MIVSRSTTFHHPHNGGLSKEPGSPASPLIVRVRAAPGLPLNSRIPMPLASRASFTVGVEVPRIRTLRPLTVIGRKIEVLAIPLMPMAMGVMQSGPERISSQPSTLAMAFRSLTATRSLGSLRYSARVSGKKGVRLPSDTDYRLREIRLTEAFLADGGG